MKLGLLATTVMGTSTGAAMLLAAAPASAQESPATTNNTAPDAPVATTPVTDSSGGPDGDVIVTATKRAQSIRDVALPISAVTGDQLAKANANSLADYITRLPGVVFNDYQPGISEVVIRGVAATTYHEQGQTTVGYYLNEIPLEEPGFPIVIPDVDTFDLDRVEVLRGPQGTLFGSSTLGGLVNYVVKTADPSGLHAAAEGLVSSTYNSHQPDYAGKLMLNLPLIADKLAVRVMGLQRFDAGFLDNRGTGQQGVNNVRTRGLRGSVVFTPWSGTKLTYLATYQDTKLDDQTYLDSTTQLTRTTQRPEPQSTSFLLNSLRLDQDLGFGTFTVFGSVDEKRNNTQFNYPYGYVTNVVTGPNTAQDFSVASANIKQVEGRLASAATGHVTWLVGVSYLHATKTSYDQIFAPGAQAIVGATLAPNDRIYGYISNSLNEDLGVFGEVSWRPVPQFEVTAGGRYYDTRAAASVTNQAGFLSGATGSTSGTIDQRESGFTPKATVSFRPVEGFLAYMTYSRGFRVGGINPNAGFLAAIPTNYQSDKVDNYEAGVKFDAFDKRLLIDADVFSIDWHNIQARLFGPAPTYFSYVSNAGSANIGGIEFSGTLKIARPLTFSSNATYEDAKLTAFLPDTFAAGGGYQPGTRLPGASKWSVANNLTLDLPQLPLGPTFELAHRYLSTAPVAFGNPNLRGGFSLFDARVSVTAMNHVRLMGFVDNFLDKRGVLNAPFTAQTAPAYSVTRPRTFGLRVDAGF